MDVKEKLVELIEKGCMCPDDANPFICDTDCRYKDSPCCGNERLADHLIANGVTVLPCKIGDEFWTDWVGITKVKCSMLTQKADGSWKGRFSVDNGWGSSVNVSLDEIGKTLFKTKEEAEANLLQPPKGE